MNVSSACYTSESPQLTNQGRWVAVHVLFTEKSSTYRHHSWSPGPDIPRVTTGRWPHIVLRHNRNLFAKATSIRNDIFWGRVSVQATSNRMKNAHIRARRSYIGPILRHYVDVNVTRHWNGWESCLATNPDNTTIADGRQIKGLIAAWWTSHSVLCSQCRHRRRRIYVMVCGAFCWVNHSAENDDPIHFMYARGQCLILQHDNARPIKPLVHGVME